MFRRLDFTTALPPRAMPAARRPPASTNSAVMLEPSEAPPLGGRAPGVTVAVAGTAVAGADVGVAVEVPGGGGVGDGVGDGVGGGGVADGVGVRTVQAVLIATAALRVASGS